MNYRLSVYEKAMPNFLTLKEKLFAAQKAGFDAVELSIDETNEKLERLSMSAEERKELVTLRSSGIGFDTMCLSGHRKFPMGSSDKAIEKRSMEIMEKAIILAHDLGIRIIQLAGYDVYYDEKSSEETEKRFTENLNKSAEMAAAYGVVLGIETMENDFCNTVKKGMRFVEKINSPYLQMYPDVGNVRNATPDVNADLLSGKGHIAAVHLKETKENVFRNLQFGEGRVNFAEVAVACKEAGVHLFNAEFWHKENSDFMNELLFANGFIRGHLDEVYL